MSRNESKGTAQVSCCNKKRKPALIVLCFSAVVFGTILLIGSLFFPREGSFPEGYWKIDIRGDKLLAVNRSGKGIIYSMWSDTRPWQGFQKRFSFEHVVQCNLRDKKLEIFVIGKDGLRQSFYENADVNEKYPLPYISGILTKQFSENHMQFSNFRIWDEKHKEYDEWGDLNLKKYDEGKSAPKNLVDSIPNQRTLGVSFDLKEYIYHKDSAGHPERLVEKDHRLSKNRVWTAEQEKNFLENGVDDNEIYVERPDGGVTIKCPLCGFIRSYSAKQYKDMTYHDVPLFEILYVPNGFETMYCPRCHFVADPDGISPEIRKLLLATLKSSEIKRISDRSSYYIMATILEKIDPELEGEYFARLYFLTALEEKKYRTQMISKAIEWIDAIDAKGNEEVKYLMKADMLRILGQFTEAKTNLSKARNGFDSKSLPEKLTAKWHGIFNSLSQMCDNSNKDCFFCPIIKTPTPIKHKEP